MNEKEAMSEEMLRDQHHEYRMRTDVDYFCEYTVENLYITPVINSLSGIHLYDIVDRLRKECLQYDQELDDLLDYMKGV